MQKSEMVAKMKQLAKNQEKIEEVFIKNREEHRAEIARVKRVMYTDFAELLESWLDKEVV